MQRRQAIALTTGALTSGLAGSFWSTAANAAPTKSSSSSSPSQAPTLYDATVLVQDSTIPFRFELTQKKGKVVGSFFNGDEKVSSTAGAWEGDTLKLEFAHYATKLEAKWDGTTLQGSYGRTGRPPYAFTAKAYVPPSANGQSAPSIDGQWDIAVKSPKGESAWKFFVRQSGEEVAATILRVDGDTGTLSGRYQNGKFVLSHFSGARPNLLELSVNSDGSLTLVQNGKSSYTAIRSNEARSKGLAEPADPSRWTSVQNPAEPLRFAAKDLSGKLVNESDARFAGKVVLVNISGSWCPNCHDEAPFLAALYKKYKRQGLEVVSISFEEAEQLKDLERLKAFIKNYGLEYTVLVGGEPGELKAKLPQAVNLNTWPATFFIGRDGLVRGAHAGFASKATGVEHERVKADFHSKIDRLLAENVRSAR